MGGGIRNIKNKPSDTNNGVKVNTETEYHNFKTRRECEGKLLVQCLRYSKGYIYIYVQNAHLYNTPFVTTGPAELCINLILHAVLIKGKEEKDEA
jgi:hypothetical protein